MDRNYDFVIISPPRCGTAWLSNLLSHGSDSYCQSEAISHALLGNPYPPAKPEWRFFGNADCMYAHNPAMIPEKAIKIGVFRKERPLVASARRAGLPDDRIAKMCRNMVDMIAAEVLDLVVFYDDLVKAPEPQRIEACKKVWKTALPGVEWSQEHWFRVNALHINHAASPC